MITRHLNTMMDRLERTLDVGAAEVTKQELLRWYGAQRYVKSIWRDVQEKWREVEPDQPLFIGEGDGFWLLVYGEGLTASKDAWLKPASEWAGVSV